MKQRRRFRLACQMVVATLLMSFCSSYGYANDVKPYDPKLMRLSEILGAIHYLRELCGANEGQAWRDKMQVLLKSEGTTEVRRAKFARSFNQGYQSYSRTYQSCTPTAKTAIAKFLGEGATIAETLVKEIP